MPATSGALEIGSYAASQALLIAAITFFSVLAVCSTVILLVLLAEPGDRLEAIRALAPTLPLSRAPRSQRGGPRARSGRCSGRCAQSTPANAGRLGGGQQTAESRHCKPNRRGSGQHHSRPVRKKVISTKKTCR